MKTIKTNINHVLFIIKYIWKTEKRYILFGIPEIILKAFDPFIMVIFPKLIIDKLLEENRTELFPEVLRIALVMVALSIIVKLSLVVLNTCITNAFNSFDRKHHLNVGKKIMSMDFEYIENPKILDLFYRTRQTHYCEEMYTSISSIISDSITCIGLIAILSHLQFAVIIVLLLIVLINVKCNQKVQQYNYQWHKEAAPYDRVNNYLLQLMHGFEFGKDVRVYNMEPYLEQKYHKFNNKYLKALYNITIKFLKLNLITSFVNLLQQGGIYIYLAYKVVFDKLSIGSFTMLLTSVQNLTNCLINISGNIVTLNKSSNYIKEFSYVMSLESKNKNGNKKLDVAKKYAIEFEDVSFMYPNTDFYVLKDINVKIDGNEKVAVVGTNGSGKTTFVKLLLRLYQPTKGTIKLNGVNINDIDYDSYMSIFSSVFQDFRIYAYSILENIALQEDCDREKLQDIINMVKIDEKVKSLPKGVDTPMFKFQDEEGIELSGGEQQKLVIARALYKDTPVLVLDEPTAALDPLMEYEIYQCILRSILEKTVIFVSHRLSISKFCNKVLVFKDGAVIQEGTHSELMKDKENLYFEMYSKQAEFYEED